MSIEDEIYDRFTAEEIIDAIRQVYGMLIVDKTMSDNNRQSLKKRIRYLYRIVSMLTWNGNNIVKEIT